MGSARGSIHVEAVAIQPDQRLSERLGLATADYVALSVRDTGPGMDAATLQRIFEPFFTTKPTGQGTGLGLSLSYDIVKAHGGELKVETGTGEGARFIIVLPLN